MNALNTTINEVVEAIKKDHEKELAALKAKLGEARGLLKDVAEHLHRTSTGLTYDNQPYRLPLTIRVEDYLTSIKKIPL